MTDLSITITDATIVMFERLTGQLFSRSRNRQEEVWRMGKARVGKLMQLLLANPLIPWPEHRSWAGSLHCA